jgi:signal transduction histidine kinase
VQGFLATMTDSARHMGVLLDGLLELSRIGSMPLQLDAVAPLPIIRDVCAELSAQHRSRSLEWHLPEHLPTVQADVGLLRLVLTHILGNAAKFTAPRALGVVEVIGRQTTEYGGALELVVADNGVGFNPALQERLFIVFGRLHSAREFEGVGLGLVLSRKALQRIHGAVEIEAVHHRSCRVRILLPRAPDG